MTILHVILATSLLNTVLAAVSVWQRHQVLRIHRENNQSTKGEG